MINATSLKIERSPTTRAVFSTNSNNLSLNSTGLSETVENWLTIQVQILVFVEL